MFVIQQRARCPTSRPMHRIRMECPASERLRQWANSGPTARLPKWHSSLSSPRMDLGTSGKINALMGSRNSRASHHSLFFLSGRLPPHFHKEIYMDWDTAMRRELKRFNAAAKRAIAKRDAGEVASMSPTPQPTTWDEALKRMLRKARRKVARMVKADAPLSQERSVEAK